MTRRSDWDDGVEFADDDVDLLRSFTMTGKHIPDQLPPMEAIVRRTGSIASLNPTQAVVYELVDDRRSIAELSALGKVPLGATRVIVAQLVADGALAVHETVSPQLSQDGQFLRRLRALVATY